MKTCLLLLISFYIFGAISGWDHFDDLNNISPNVVYPENVQPLNGNIPQDFYQQNCKIVCDAQGINCNADCGSPNVQCPGYCGQAPGLCNQGCQQPQVVKVPIPRTVTETVTRTVQKEARRVKVGMEYDALRQCPLNYKMVGDDVKRCEEDESPNCPPDYELRNERCVRTVVSCPNEYTTYQQNCSLRVVCPRDYIQRGDECVPSNPQCPYGWRWNGKVCEPERSTCPSGYILRSDNRCIQEVQKCLPNYKQYGNQCVKDQPRCMPDFHLDRNTNMCIKTIKKCPLDSYERFGECVSTTYTCPSHTRESGDHCIYENVVERVVYDVKYVPQQITVPGSNCNLPDGGCVSPCAGNCLPGVQNVQGFNGIIQ